LINKKHKSKRKLRFGMNPNCLFTFKIKGSAMKKYLILILLLSRSFFQTDLAAEYKPYHHDSGRLPQPAGIGFGGFGVSSALSGNGKYLAVGAPTYPFPYIRTGGVANRVGPGLVTIYKIKSGHAPELIQTLIAPDEVNFSNFPSAGGSVRSGPHSDFGFGVSFDKSGSILAITGTGDDQTGTLNGAIWIYQRNPNSGLFEYVQKVSPIIPGNFIFALLGAGGTGVTVNSKGTLIAAGVIGVPNAAVTDLTNGGVVVLKRTSRKSNTWSQVIMEGAMYLAPPSDLTPGSTFGFSLQFDASGKYLVVGAPNDIPTATAFNNQGRGATYVFKSRPGRSTLFTDGVAAGHKNNYSDLVFQQVGSKIVGTPSSAGNQNQGYPVAITGNGQTIASYGSDVLGQAYVYVFRNQDGQYVQTEALPLGTFAQGSDLNVGQNQSGGLAFSKDGRRLVVGVPKSVELVGAPAPGIFKGSIQVYNRKEGRYSLSQTITDPNSTANAHQGTSVTLDDSGKIIAFGGGTDNNSTGSEYLWIERK
jgi:WD40 repeat protein